MNGMISGTTQSHSFDDKICKLMIELLDSTYPVTKIKKNKRFRRGVSVNGRNGMVLNDSLVLFGGIYSSLKLRYDASDKDITHVIKKYYN